MVVVADTGANPWGLIFVAMLAVCVLTYVGIGMGVGRHKIGRLGLQAHPHWPLWLELVR